MSTALKMNKDRKVGSKLVGMTGNVMNDTIIVRNDDKMLSYSVKDVDNITIVNVNKVSKESDFVVLSISEFEMISKL
ncbi:MAG: hypothetical protein RSC93_00415 [Erysipelotrichaceae bacterium]